MDQPSLFLGLGYTSDAKDASPSEDGAASALLRQYMQQCLEYHDEQQQKEEASTTLAPTAASIMPTVPPGALHESTSVAPITPLAVAARPPPTVAPQLQPPKSTVQQDLSSVEKARAIAQRFHQELELRKTNQEDGSVLHHTAGELLSPAEYAVRRARHFEKEQERLRRAMLKNFEYVVRKDDEALQLQLQQLQRAQERQAAQQQQQQQQRAGVFSTKAGIGTAKRQKTEQRRHAQGHLPQQATAVVYVSNLPPVPSSEETLRQLFASYGTIQKVHLYRDKATGQLKGDGLVVYQVSNKEKEAGDLLNDVCLQVGDGRYV